MSPSETRNALSNPLLAIGLGLLGGLVVILLSLREGRFADGHGGELEIRINGVEQRMSRDVLLPDAGWVLQVALPPGLPQSIRDSLSVTLRAERTGAMIEIADQLSVDGDLASLVIPESLGLFEGLLSIRAALTDDDAHELVAYRRVRIRSWLGGPPIGARQIIHFDFEVDRDDDGRPDFQRDLEHFGLATPDRPELASAVAAGIAERALARVRRAYDPDDDPNGTGLERDPVLVRFLLEADPSPYVTRICVGGSNLAHPRSVGNVRFDHRNERRSSKECDGPEPAGLFPAELTIYESSPLYGEVLGPFLPERGGAPVGSRSQDGWLLAAPAASAAAQGERARAIQRAIDVFGDALGTIMAHESAHALGLVPAGRPGVGLFGGEEEAGEEYAHNLDAFGQRPSRPWLMNVGTGFRFEDLAGRGEAGELRFRPLNHAYLKDRVVLVDGRSD